MISDRYIELYEKVTGLPFNKSKATNTLAEDIKTNIIENI
jgi:hypothetical protein